MTRVVLTRDTRTKLFVVPAMILRSDVKDCIDPGGDPVILFDMFVDTGSNQSSISEEVAGRCGIALPHRQRQATSGVGGFASTPIISSLPFYLLADGNPVPVRLPRLTVLEDREETEVYQEGPIRKRRIRRLPGVSLLGLDALGALSATLVVSAATDQGSIDL
jgi:hypothetical protein